MDLSFFPPPPTNHGDKARWLDACATVASNEYRRARTRSMAFAWLRFFAFAALVAGLYLATAGSNRWGLALAPIGLIAFVAAVRAHGRVKSRVQTLSLLKTVLEESRQRIDGEPVIIRAGDQPNDVALWHGLFVEPAERGTATVDGNESTSSTPRLSEQELGDLDVFGHPISLFGLLNRTSSPAGAARLAHALTQPLMEPQSIEERQVAVRWFADHPIRRQRLLAAAAGFRSLSKEFRQLYETLRDATPMPGGRALRAARLWGLAGPIAVLLWLGQLLGWHTIPVGGLPLVVVVIINVIILRSIRKETADRIRPWLNLDDVVAQMRFFADSAIEALPEDALLGAQRGRLAAAAQRDILPRLEARIPILFFGLSGILHAVVDILVLWDLQAVALIESVAIRHRQALLRAIAAAGEAEFLACLGTYAWEEEGATFPVVCVGPPQLQIDAGRHPLIARSEAVSNSMALAAETRTWIVTGSNMSGKSTFLRMTASNALLAMIGSAVPARHMRLTPLEILTDLRIRDDLSRKESYFLAEVRQVHRMVEAARTGRPVFALIDEPFRGTNSAERVAAASAVVRSLIAGSGLHLVATHDAALTTLGDHRNAANKHFQERFEDAGLIFDYQLHDGPARSRNALRVLEVEGYPPDLVADAKRMAEELGEASA